MEPNGPLVVALWGAANAVLVIILRGYAGNGMELGEYSFAVGIVELYALGALISLRRHETRRYFYVPRTALPALICAFGFGVAAWGLAYWPWPEPVAGFLIFAGLSLAFHDRKRTGGEREGRAPLPASMDDRPSHLVATERGPRLALLDHDHDTPPHVEARSRLQRVLSAGLAVGAAALLRRRHKRRGGES